MAKTQTLAFWRVLCCFCTSKLLLYVWFLNYTMNIYAQYCMNTNFCEYNDIIIFIYFFVRKLKKMTNIRFNSANNRFIPLKNFNFFD